MKRQRRSGPPRYGEHHLPKIRERELALLQRLAELRAEGLGWEASAEVLNLEGFRTRKGTRWTGASLHSAFRRRRLPRRD